MQSGVEGLCKGGRGGGGAATCSSAMPDPEVLADDGSPQRGGAAAGPPRGIEPRPPLAIVPAGGPSRWVKTAVECQRTTCSAIVRNIDMPSRMRMARSGKTQSLSACMSAPSSRHISDGSAIMPAGFPLISDSRPIAAVGARPQVLSSHLAKISRSSARKLAYARRPRVVVAK